MKSLSLERKPLCPKKQLWRGKSSRLSEKLVSELGTVTGDLNPQWPLEAGIPSFYSVTGNLLQLLTAAKLVAESSFTLCELFTQCDYAKVKHWFLELNKLMLCPEAEGYFSKVKVGIERFVTCFVYGRWSPMGNWSSLFTCLFCQLPLVGCSCRGELQVLFDMK